MPAGLSRASKLENVSTTLSAGITDVATSMDVNDASNLNYPSYLVIDRVDASGTLKSTSLWEYVKVTNIVGSTLTITRAQGGSTQQSHSSGAVVEAVMTATLQEEYYASLNPEHTATGGHVISTATVADLRVSIINASGASVYGNVVNLGSAQTITGVKTFSATPVITSFLAYADSRYKVGTFTRDISIASGSQEITGVGFTPKAILFITGGFGTSAGLDDGTTYGCMVNYAGPNFVYYSGGSIYFHDGTNTYAGRVTTLGADGFTIAWTKGASPTGTMNIIYLAVR